MAKGAAAGGRLASDPVPGRDNGRSKRPTEAAALLCERYRDRVFGYCLYTLGNRDEAEDATQTTFLYAFRALRRGVVPAVETAWLLKIAENVCLSWRRSAARRRRVETATDVVELREAVPARDGSADELIALEDALADMPPAQRRAILLREWQGLSYREIGERLRLSQAAVETLLFRARRTLATNLTVSRETRGRLARAFDFGGLVGALKSAFAGGAAVKVAATVAAIATGTVLAGPPAVGNRASVDKEALKDVDVLVARESGDRGSALATAERMDVSMGVSGGTTAAGGGLKAVTAKHRKADATKDERAGSDAAASPEAGAAGDVSPSWMAASPGRPSTETGAAADSPPSSEATSPGGPSLVAPPLPSLVPSVPSALDLSPQPPSVPLEPPVLLSLNAPSLNPSGLPLELPSLPVEKPLLPLEEPAPSLELPSLPLLNPPALPLEPPALPVGQPAVSLEPPPLPLEPPSLPLEEPSLPLDPPALPVEQPALPPPPPSSLPLEPPAPPPLNPPALRVDEPAPPHEQSALPLEPPPLLPLPTLFLPLP